MPVTNAAPTRFTSSRSRCLGERRGYSSSSCCEETNTMSEGSEGERAGYAAFSFAAVARSAAYILRTVSFK